MLFRSSVVVGANVTVNTSTVFVGNSTVNTAHTSAGLTVGANVTVNATTVFVGNSSVNTAITGTGITLTGNLTASGTVSMGSSFLRNRIINGDMRIDQRSGGASVTAVDNSYVTADRWRTFSSAASKFTVQQQTSVAPTGFTTALKATSSSSYTPTSGQSFGLNQPIEGFNCEDLAWGTASAKTITLSFQVYSSLKIGRAHV